MFKHRSKGSHLPNDCSAQYVCIYRKAGADVRDQGEYGIRHLTHKELWQSLEELSGRAPELVDVCSIGHSHEGRDIALVTLTSRTTGRPGGKPALWVDAGIHALELTGTAAALHLIARLTDGYGSDGLVTRVLDSRTVYVVPRQNPDGAEAVLSDPPRYFRSSTRPWRQGCDGPLLAPGDIDGDGRILLMRVPDDAGSWRVSDVQPRLLAPRGLLDSPGDGHFFRLMPEGMIENYDGLTIPPVRPASDLDLNRNYPFEWAPAPEQPGAGPAPLSEPEARAVAEAILARPNIGAYLTYHTTGGYHLHPYGDRPAEALPAADRIMYQQLGRLATELTGYPSMSTRAAQPAETFRGTQDDWAYDHLGLMAWTTELWNVWKAAGLQVENVYEWLTGYHPEDDLALLAWSDRAQPSAYVDWYPFRHPQLGTVELGGWNLLQLYNPPGALIGATVRTQPGFAMACALALPELAIRALRTTQVTDMVWRVDMAVQNIGQLPTHVTQKALDRGIDLPLRATIRTDRGTVCGDSRVIAGGQLAGRSWPSSGVLPSTLRQFMSSSGHLSDQARFSWLIAAPAGTSFTTEVSHPRAGHASAKGRLR
jgi:murein tripeptide amidase MpaA